MIQMPEAHAIVHAWLIDVTNTVHLDGEEVFKNLQRRIVEAKVVWEQAARELSSKMPDQKAMLTSNAKYQTICDLERTSLDMFNFWANKHRVTFASEGGYE